MIGNSSGSALRVGGFIVACGLLMGATGAYAASGEELQFILNTFSFLVWGVLIMWMCAGFTMLEAGSVRTKNASMICLKNIGLYSIAGITYYLVGYNLMYVDVQEGWIGTLKFLYGPSDNELKLLSGQAAAAADVTKAGHATMSDWFFQMVFVATTASIVSGTLAERVKLWAFLAFTVVLTIIIYPIVGAWTWGGGWLSAMGFQDFAGSTIVHSTGGWAALAGALVVGARHGKFRADGSVKATAPSNIPAVTLGVFILWLGWFGFNGGSQLALSSAARCRRHEQCAREYQPCGSGRRHSCSHRIAADLRTHRSARRPQRRARRPRFHYGRARYRRSLLGAHNWCYRRRVVRRRDEVVGGRQARRRCRCDSGPLVRWRLGDLGGLHCSRWQLRRPAHWGVGGGRVRVCVFVARVVCSRQDNGGAGVANR